VKLPHYWIMYVLSAWNVSACSGCIKTEDSEGSRRHAATGSRVSKTVYSTENQNFGFCSGGSAGVARGGTCHPK
jgi:hypothetical protein